MGGRARPERNSDQAWEKWHFGFGPNPRDRQHPAQYDKARGSHPGVALVELQRIARA